MSNELLTPDYIFESSWEVCNKVGGIYTVLSSRAKTLQEAFPDRIIFIGPDFWKENESPYFCEDKALLAEWQWEAKEGNREHGLPQRRDLGGASVSTGDPFRVDVPTNLHPRVLRTTRLLSGDRVAVRGGSTVQLKISSL